MFRLSRNLDNNSRLITILLLLILSFYLSKSSKAEVKSQNEFIWQVGEELIYDVKWMSLSVASLKFHIIKKDTVRNCPVYLCRLYLDSNSKLPFVNIHEVYDSYIDEEMYSHQINILIKKHDFRHIH